MHKLCLALGQVDIVLGDPQANLAKVSQMAADAAGSGADLILLPELWSTGYDLARAGEHASSFDEGIFADTADLARRNQIHIVGSCLSRLAQDGIGNTAVWFGPGGEILGSYSKVHLFRLMHEEQFLAPGDKLSLVSSPWGKAGLAICYDLRFPELFRKYALAGAKLILLPSEWPNPRMDHWRTLLRARAIENQCFLAACNRVGQSGSDHFFGRSAVIGPWGEMVEEGGEKEELLLAEIDLDIVDEIRAQIPVFEDRRTDIYG